jgi:hypothetical protein
MVSFWARTDRVAPSLAEGERERRDAARTEWADMLSRIAIAPTLDPDRATAVKTAGGRLR